MRFLMLFIYLALILFGVTFAVLNASMVEVNVYVKTLQWPMSLLLAVTLGIGMLIGFFLFTYRYWRLQLAYHKLKTQLRLTEKEIRNLRAIPLQD